MSIEFTPITSDADYERGLSRLRSMFNVPAKDAEEAEELRLLSEEMQRYSLERFQHRRAPTDGVDEVIAGLDYDKLTLEDALDAFGGLERFVEYMTRRRGLDAATLKVLVGEFGLDRAELEKAHCDRAGWEYVLLDGQEPCGDVECCPVGERDWRLELAELTGIGRIGQDLGEPVGALT